MNSTYADLDEVLQSQRSLEEKRKAIGEVTKRFGHSNLFGYQLGVYLKLADLSQRELAQKIAVSPSTISHWMAGRRLPDASAIYWIVKALELGQEDSLCLLSALNVDVWLRQAAEYFDVALVQGELTLGDLNTFQKIYPVVYMMASFALSSYESSLDGFGKSVKGRRKRSASMYNETN